MARWRFLTQVRFLLCIPTIEQRGSSRGKARPRMKSWLPDLSGSPLCKGSWPRSGLRDCQTPDLPGIFAQRTAAVNPSASLRSAPPFTQGRQGRAEIAEWQKIFQSAQDAARQGTGGNCGSAEAFRRGLGRNAARCHFALSLSASSRGYAAAIFAEKSVRALAPLGKGSWPRSGLRD